MPTLFPDRDYPVICTHHRTDQVITRVYTASSLATAVARAITADQKENLDHWHYGTSLDHQEEAERLGFPVYQWRDITDRLDVGRILGNAIANLVNKQGDSK